MTQAKTPMTFPVANDLFVSRDRSTYLLAGRSRRDGFYRFPLPGGPEATLYDRVEIGPRGWLWSYTIQRFCPKPPFNGHKDGGEFQPYAVGYVEFPELIVEGRIVVDDFSTLRIGQPMVLTTEAYRHDHRGEVLTYAFAPNTTEEPAQ
jgi:uncharacterized OB-fold protein